MQSKLEWLIKLLTIKRFCYVFPTMQGNIYPKLIVFGTIMTLYFLVLQTTSPENNVNTAECRNITLVLCKFQKDNHRNIHQIYEAISINCAWKKGIWADGVERRQVRYFCLYLCLIKNCKSHSQKIRDCDLKTKTFVCINLIYWTMCWSMCGYRTRSPRIRNILEHFIF